MATEITIPDFDFAALYYPELLEALIQYKRRNVPELTDESEFEPFIQLLRAFALVGHMNNVLIDLVANESTLPTAKLTEQVRNMLRLIDYELRPATPAQVDVVYELSRVFAAAFELIPEAAQAATRKEGDTAAIPFEALTALTISRTDEHTSVLAEESGAFTDYTAKANSSTPTVDDFAPWATPAVKDALYWGHDTVMWDELGVTLVTAAANIVGVWEFYDGEWRKTAPTSVDDLGSTLEVDLTSLLGATNRQGTMVRVQLNSTTAYEDVESTWNGSANIATVGLLGQTSPSTDPSDYTVGSDWTILEDATDGTSDLTVSGQVEYPIPQTLTQNWQRTTINSIEAYWLRYRIVQASGATAPTLRRTRMDEGKQYALRSATQGQSRTDDPLGSSTGLADQTFTTTKDNYINGTMVPTVSGEEWTVVDNFLNSAAADKHVVVTLGQNDRATLTFGDGVNGKIPPIGVGNIAASYRYGASMDGNVGAQTVVVDKTGLTYINKLFNPRQATGWAEAQGASEASLERAKIEGPASLRVGTVAIGPDDVIALTVSFTDSDGASPFGRATVFEEGFGPKTMEVVVVAKGGGLASASQLAALELYFNGDRYANPPVEKHLIANQEVGAVNYTPKSIDVTATVYGDVEEQAVVNRLSQVIQPEALKLDGVTYEWAFGGEVPLNRLIHEIFETDDSITNVVITTPAADVPLAARELPVSGTFNITVVEP